MTFTIPQYARKPGDVCSAFVQRPGRMGLIVFQRVNRSLVRLGSTYIPSLPKTYPNWNVLRALPLHLMISSRSMKSTFGSTKTTIRDPRNSSVRTLRSARNPAMPPRSFCRGPVRLASVNSVVGPCWLLAYPMRRFQHKGRRALVCEAEAAHSSGKLSSYHPLSYTHLLFRTYLLQSNPSWLFFRL